LLEHAQGVGTPPGFHDLAVSDAVEVDARDGYVVFCWGDSHKLAPMRAGNCPTFHDLIPFSNLVINSEMEVREGGKESGGGLLELLEGCTMEPARIVAQVIGGVEFVYCAHVSLVPEVIKRMAENLLVGRQVTGITGYFRWCAPREIFAPHRRNNAELLEHTQGVMSPPHFHTTLPSAK